MKGFAVNGFSVNGKRQGFTIVELLIIIILIGVLSSTMLLSGREAVATSTAVNIVNNMIQIKTATYAWYKNNLSRIIPDSSSGYKIRTSGTNQEFKDFVASHKSEILDYLDNASSITLRSSKDSKNEPGDYMLIALDDARKWYVCCNLGSGYYRVVDPDDDVKGKVASRAQNLGLSGMDSKSDTSMTAEIYTDQQFACMLILELP